MADIKCVLLDNSNIKIEAILLAAGSSSRLGQPKQLLSYKGKPLVTHVIELVEESNIHSLIVVLGAYQDKISHLINTPHRLAFNPDWKAGMGSSLATGIRLTDKECDAVMILIVDQIHLKIDIINSLIERFFKNPTKIICAEYKAGIFGPPAIFPSFYFSELRKLEGDKGAKQLLTQIRESNPEGIEFIAFEKGIEDIDVPDDLAKLE